MKDNDRLLLVLAVAGGGWYLYTRSQGLTLTGQPANPMLPPGVVRPGLSTISPNNSLNTLATNVFSSLGQSLQSIFKNVSKSAPGNGPSSPSSTGAGISAADVASWGLQVPIVDAPPPGYYDTATPFWSMPSYALNQAPLMPWTLNPAILGFDPSYIPPPPG